MADKEILDVLAPCGLNCKKCLANAKGEIKYHSITLKNLLGSFDRYAERFSGFMPVFKNYQQFKDLLEFLTRGNCNGCRSGDCKYPNCGVAKCYQEKGVDFCFQCDEFPCDRTNFDPELKQRWLQMNNRMREIGIEAYFDETKDLPRYI
ncbi:MAG: DUF3795 domain-containing protein [bacterium]|nr:DUF3795 domain-containing protein [bacterium]